MRYAVLGLGDTNYAQFCQAAKDIARRLQELGATSLTPRVDSDVEYDAAAQAWFDAVSAALADTVSNVSPAVASAIADNEALLADACTATSSKKNPFLASLLTNLRRSGEHSEKETRHFEISLRDSGL